MQKPLAVQLPPMLLALNHLGLTGRRHLYAGTVPAATIARRRAANKVARKSRRANRLAAQR